jgi:glucose-1-phosphate adenylyltransferase
MEELLNNEKTDFGKEIIPMAIKSKQVNSYIFNDYWEDIGTIRSFYEATLDLTNPTPSFDFYEETRPIYTQTSNLPPSKINNADMEATLACEGCVIENSRLQKSVIGIRSIIKEGCDLNGVIVMGSDFYETAEEKKENERKKIPNLGIGRNCKINKAIIDKNAHIGNNCCINVNGKTYEDGDHGLFYSSDGIIVIRKGAVIPDGTVI